MLVTAARVADGHRSTAPAIAAALEAARSGRGPERYTREMGWVVIAFQNAFYHLAHTAELRGRPVDTIGPGGDTDTNGAIVGALLGVAESRRAIPARWTSLVLGYRPIEELGATQPRPAESWPDDLAEALVMARREASRHDRSSFSVRLTSRPLRRSARRSRNRCCGGRMR